MSSLHRKADQVHSNPPAPAPWFGIFDGPDADADPSAFAGPEPEVDGVALTLPDWLREQATHYNAVGTGAARWLAGELGFLAELAARLDAATADVFADRRAFEEACRAEDLVYAGRVRGLEEGRAEGPGGPAFGHDD